MALPEELRVEVASPDDRIAVAHLNVWAYREFAFDLGAELWPVLVKALTAVAPPAGNATFLVVREDGDLVGSAAYRPPGLSMSPVPRAWASVDLLAVSPDARHRGVATALVLECLERASADGAPALGAKVPGYTAAAQELFTKLGFHREQGLAKRNETAYWLYFKELG
jgi:ribosomal protein S18 acetylase RimI-like enzyme